MSGQQRAVQHITGDQPGRGLCGADIEPRPVGLTLTCTECWRIHRGERGGGMQAGSHPRLL